MSISSSSVRVIDCPTDASAKIAVGGHDPRHVAHPAGGLHADGVARLHGTGHDRPRVPAKVEVRAVHPLDRHPQRLVARARLVDLDALEEPHQRRSPIPAHGDRFLDDVVPLHRGDRDAGDRGELEIDRQPPVLLLDPGEHLPRIADEIHLVHRQDHVPDAEQRHDEAVTAGLGEDPLSGVDQDDAQIGGRCPGHHVAGVLLVAGRVGDDEVPPRGREVAVGDVDGDPLLALGGEPVEQQRIVELTGARPHPLRVDRQRGELVVEQRLGLVEHAADERALAVVDAAAGVEAQEARAGLLLVHLLERHGSGAHQKYPSCFLISIEPGAS